MEGVIGIDVTVDTIANKILALDFPWNGYGILLGKDGTILALPQAGEQDWGLDEITNHDYAEAITKDTFKPGDFNVYKRADLKDLARALNQNESGETTLVLNGQTKVATWSTIALTGWKLMVLVPENQIFAEVDHIQNRLSQIGLLAAALLILMNLVLLYGIFRLASTTSKRIAEPLQSINEIVTQIGEGHYHQESPVFKVTELQETADKIVAAGLQLNEAMSNNVILKSAKNLKSVFIANMSHEIRTPLNALAAPCNSAARQVVRREFNRHLVARIDADVVHAHFAGDVRQYLVAIGQLHFKHGVGKGLGNNAFHFDYIRFGQSLTPPCRWRSGSACGRLRS